MSEIEQSELETETTSAPLDAADIPAAAFSAVEDVVAVVADESAVVAPTFGESAEQPVMEEPYSPLVDMEVTESVESFSAEASSEVTSDAAAADGAEETKDEDP